MQSVINQLNNLQSFIFSSPVIFTISNIVIAIISAKVTLFLTDRKEKKESQIRFANRLKSLAYELKVNFKYVGNKENPFVTKALENLVYNEPLIHHHPELFEKAQNCLNVAFLLSGAKHPSKSPAAGQSLMKDLSKHLASQFNITVPDFR